MKINSNNVFKFSGDGEVTKILEYPWEIAAAIAIPKAADLPRPLPAVNVTVFLNVFSEMTSIKVKIACA